MSNYNNSSPFEKMVSPTPSDSVDLTETGRGLLVTSVAGGSNVSFETPGQGDDGTTVTVAMAGVTVGTVIPCIVTRVNLTGTDATCFVGY